MKLQGKIEINGRSSEFLLTEEGSYIQWGADTPVLGERVALLESLGDAYRDWVYENLCIDCHDHALDDGEGADGRCGDCADRHDKEEKL